MLPNVIIGTATAGGTAIASAMVDDTWTQVKAQVVQFFAGDRDRQARIERWLDRSHAAAMASDAGLRDRLTVLHAAVWTTALEEVLAHHPERVPQVTAFVQQMQVGIG